MSAMISPVRVVVADDHPIYREGIGRGLALSGLVEVVAEAEDGIGTLAAIRQGAPDVAVVDYRLPKLDGVAVVRALVRDRLPTRAIVLSAVTQSSVVYEAIQAGAAGYLSKDTSRADVVAAVLSVAQGGTVIPPDLARGLAEEIRARGLGESLLLTERERQVLVGFGEGMSIPQIASELFLAASTVKTHTQRLYEKLGVSDRAAAVAEAMRRGLLE
jgi:two-component system nitrate/nitrite response regulator NarL